MTKPMGSISYERAIKLVLSDRALRRENLLAYFQDDEHGHVGRALDGMVVRGEVGFTGILYRAQS
jgi:hypothetical protein